MNCCGDDGARRDNKHKKHLLMMVLCCGIPLLILLLLPYIGKMFPGVSLALGSIVPFLCPVMMIGMMLMMFRNGKKEDGNESRDFRIDAK